MLTITDPNGTKTTMGPYESDVSGTYQVTFTPTSVGTYTFQFSFPGQTVNGTGFGNYYANFMASTSDAVSLTVQQAPVQGYNEAPVPLPTQYWTIPINAQNRYWSSISGPWLQPVGSFNTGFNATGLFNPYTYAPRSAHILWTKVIEPSMAGIAGGDYGSQQFGEQFSNAVVSQAIVMGGYMYYNDVPNVSINNNNGTTVNTFSCMNLQTGQIMYTVPGTITNGQILEWRDQQMKDTEPYLWAMPSLSFGATYYGPWKLYDARTGALLATWDFVPAGTTVARGQSATSFFAMPVILPPWIENKTVTPLTGAIVNEPPNPTVVGQNIGGAEGGGALLVYVLGSTPGAPTGWLACWNSTLAINSWNNNPQVWNLAGGAAGFGGSFPSVAEQEVTPLDWEMGIMWNITIPNPTYMGQGMPAYWSILGADGDYVILSSGPPMAPASNPADTGTESFLLAGIYVKDLPMTTTFDYGIDIGGDTQHTTAGTFAWEKNITMPAYDQTWGPGYAGLQNGGIIVFYDGSTLSVTAYSEHTGALLWSANPFNNYFATQPVSGIQCAAYGMLYEAGYDGYMHAINATTGVQQWQSITRVGGLEMPQPAYPCSECVVADNEVFTTTGKGYEAQPLYRGHCLYAYDAMTGAQNWNISGQISINVIADGILEGFNSYDGRQYAFSRGPTATTASATLWGDQNIVISGTVTDQTPGIAMGTPAISDAWMTPWMEYLYMDQPYPSQATGVPVSIDAVDPNNNFVHIGNAVSDITGTYHYTWTPPDIPGTYTIIATFSADNSYYSSSGETAAVVVSPAAATPPPQYPVPMDYTMAILAAAIAVIIAVAIVGLILLRKKP
jgi:hypothetical protein